MPKFRRRTFTAEGYTYYKYLRQDNNAFEREKEHKCGYRVQEKGAEI
jgi:hypothetical protein